MNIARRFFLELFPLLAWRCSSLLARESQASPIFLGQGTTSGEVTDSSVLLQTRLTLAEQLDPTGELLGAGGEACFERSTQADFTDAHRTPFQPAVDTSDFIVRGEGGGEEKGERKKKGQEKRRKKEREREKRTCIV